MESSTNMTCIVVTNGTFPWWDLPALLSWYHRVYPSPFPPVSLSSVQYYQLLRHTLSLPSSMWLLTSRASPIVLPKTLYPVKTPTISLYTRISYLDFQANIMELRFHPRTINELRRAYDYFLDKSYALRMYNSELKTALRGRFLYRLESWVERIGCEAIKAAIREDMGCGDFGAWCDGMAKWEAEEMEMLKAKKEGGNGQPRRFITVGEQAVINRYADIMGVSLGGRKQRRKERQRSQKTKTGVVEYVKAGFVPCLEEAPDIWRMTFKVPKGWVWASYPELAPILSLRQTPVTPCLKQKFPGLCQSLGVTTPATGNPRVRGGKTRPPAPSNKHLASIYEEGTTASGALGKRKPGTYQTRMEWHPTPRAECWDVSESYEDEETPTIKRARPSIDEDEESPMDLETPCTPVPSPAEIDPLKPITMTEDPTSTPVFWPPHPHSAGQETAPAAIPAHSPADAADTRVLTASWNRQIKVVQKQNQGLPSPRIPLLYSPLSYMKHRTRRLEAREIVALERESMEERMEDENVCESASSPPLPAQKPELYPTPPADEEVVSSPILLISSSPVDPGCG